MGTYRLIFIRTDGNAQIATGHLMRCLSIADACQKLGMEVRFLVSDEESASLLKVFSNDTCVTILKTAHYQHLMQELSELTTLLQAAPEAVLLVDSYAATCDYFTALCPYVRLAYLDDLQAINPSIDLAVNYDVIPDACLPAYEQAYSNARIRLLGASYAPLRSQFTDSHFEVREYATDILITTGGTDQEHFSLGLLEQLSAMPESFLSLLTFHLVIGSKNSDIETIRQTFSSTDFSCRILLHEQITDMAALMLSCDLAVSASGTTLYELCALGIPTISFTVADNQLPSAKAFALTGAISCAGDVRMERPLVYRRIFDYIEKMTVSSDNFTKRQSAHRKMCRLVDGHGSVRIAEALQKL